jgi:hypothetical protein
MTHQAEDNKTHIAYYNSTANVSFVWNGTQGNLADICAGGYGERVVGKLVLSQDYNKLPVEKALEAFSNECTVFLALVGYNVPS